MTTGRLLRIGAAVAILISGIVHLDLYFNQQYNAAPPGFGANFGRSIALNVVLSGIIAIALVARRDWYVKAAGLALSAGTIALFAYTHGGNTFLNFSHNGPMFDPSPQAQIMVITLIVAIVLLAASFLPAVHDEATDREAASALPFIGGAFAVTAIVLIGLTIRWQPDDQQSVSSPTDTSTSADPAVTTTAPAAPAASTVPGDTTPAPDASTTTVAGGAAPAGAQAVSIADFAFDAPDLSVAAGSTVTWTNNDSAPHSVVAEDDSFSSEDLAQGDTFEQTFDTAGTFPYLCGIHNYMTGTITVTG